MLVLSRKVGEQIVLPECGVTIAVLEIRGDKIQLGISAPPELPVHRREVWERIQAGLVRSDNASPAEEEVPARAS